jgi:hypothetical protein
MLQRESFNLAEINKTGLTLDDNSLEEITEKLQSIEEHE